MCEGFLEKKYQFEKVFLTNSCTMALEMSAILADIQPGDEVIMPSFTFVSTANAFALRGARIVFADSRKDHPNMDEDQINRLITPKTKAIVVVHYGGVAVNMDVIMSIAKRNNLMVIEDAAACIDSFYNGKALGTIGDIGCFSFHETKNIHCGEGGFIAINNSSLLKRAEIIRNKGTNRSAFSRGEVNRYEWVDLGFSSIPSAITAAFLYSNLEKIDDVGKQRSNLWERYYNCFIKLGNKKIGLPVIPEYSQHNSHVFYLLCQNEIERNNLISYLEKNNIQAVFHYQALHDSPFYKAHHAPGDLPNAYKFSDSLIRLPLYYDLSMESQDLICNKILKFYSA